MIFVDYREADVLAKMRQLFVPPKYPFTFASAAMDVADIIVCRIADAPPAPPPMVDGNDGDTAVAEVDAPPLYIRIDGAEARPSGWPARCYVPLFAIERKTRTDLAASIAGSASNVPGFVRFSDQKMRMRAYGRQTGATLLLAIEGLFGGVDTPLRGGITEDGLDTSLLKAALTDDFIVVHTLNSQRTARLVGKLARYAVVNAMTTGQARGTPSTASAISVRKADNYDASTYYRAILTAVPRMTPAAAASVARVYPTADALISAWREQEGTARARERMLEKLEISGPGAKRTRGGKLYKMGRARSQLLYTLLGAGIESTLTATSDTDDDLTLDLTSDVAVEKASKRK